MKYVYNNSPIYTLLFKNGNLEIKPKKYYEAKDEELSIFEQCRLSGQVTFYKDLKSIPKPEDGIVSQVVTEVPRTSTIGLTAEELQAEKDKSMSTVSGIKVTKLGVAVEDSPPNQIKDLAEEDDKSKQNTQTPASASDSAPAGSTTSVSPEVDKKASSKPRGRQAKAKSEEVETKTEVAATPLVATVQSTIPTTEELGSWS